ncbi:MAG: toxin YoeB [Glaciecola sp.]|jgi:toxin YoeB
MKRKITFTTNAWNEYMYWQGQDKKIVKKINKLIKAINSGDPFQGIGKPEPLKYDLAGFWSRRIDGEHRLVYEATIDTITIVQCRFHY